MEVNGMLYRFVSHKDGEKIENEYYYRENYYRIEYPLFKETRIVFLLKVKNYKTNEERYKYKLNIGCNVHIYPSRTRAVHCFQQTKP